MNTKIIIAALITAIVNFLLGWLVFGVILMDFYKSNTVQYDGLMKEMPNLLFIFLSGLLYGFLFAFIFEKWARIRTFGRGFTAGLLLGFLIMTGFDLYFLAGMNLFNWKLVITDILVNTIFSGILGGVTGFILGFNKKSIDLE